MQRQTLTLHLQYIYTTYTGIATFLYTTFSRRVATIYFHMDGTNTSQPQSLYLLHDSK